MHRVVKTEVLAASEELDQISLKNPRTKGAEIVDFNILVLVRPSYDKLDSPIHPLWSRISRHAPDSGL